MIIIGLIWFAFIGKGANVLRTGWVRVKGKSHSPRRERTGLREVRKSWTWEHRLSWAAPHIHCLAWQALAPYFPSTASSLLLSQRRFRVYVSEEDVGLSERLQWSDQVGLPENTAQPCSPMQTCHWPMMPRGEDTGYSSLSIPTPSVLSVMLKGSLCVINGWISFKPHFFQK